jgi:hypothetical protein
MPVKTRHAGGYPSNAGVVSRQRHHALVLWTIVELISCGGSRAGGGTGGQGTGSGGDGSAGGAAAGARGGTAGGSSGGMGGAIGGSAGEGGKDGGPSTCSGCTESGLGLEACPTTVGTSASCPSPGDECCAGGTQWHCGNCVAETCHWFVSCTPAEFDAGGRCSDTISCPSNQTCIADGTCAEFCTPDGGTNCPSGTTCEAATDYFNPVIVDVCR